MTRAISVALLFAAVGCTSNESSKHDYVIQGDECRVYNDQASCQAHSGCGWVEEAPPCPAGQTCTYGLCESTGGNGTGTGSGSAACACPDGGACWEQVGGTAQQAGSAPQIQCGPAYECPGGGFPCDPCASITGQGTCTLDPNVANLCLCDNGIR